MEGPVAFVDAEAALQEVTGQPVPIELDPSMFVLPDWKLCSEADKASVLETLNSHFVLPGFTVGTRKTLGLVAALQKSTLAHARFVRLVKKVVVQVVGKNGIVKGKDEEDARYGVTFTPSTGVATIVVQFGTWRTETSFAFGGKFDRAVPLLMQTEEYAEKTMEALNQLVHDANKEIAGFPPINVNWDFVNDKFYWGLLEAKRQSFWRFLVNVAKNGLFFRACGLLKHLTRSPRCTALFLQQVQSFELNVTEKLKCAVEIKLEDAVAKVFLKANAVVNESSSDFVAWGEVMDDAFRWQVQEECVMKLAIQEIKTKVVPVFPNGTQFELEWNSIVERNDYKKMDFQLREKYLKNWLAVVIGRLSNAKVVHTIASLFARCPRVRNLFAQNVSVLRIREDSTSKFVPTLENGVMTISVFEKAFSASQYTQGEEAVDCQVCKCLGVDLAVEDQIIKVLKLKFAVPFVVDFAPYFEVRQEKTREAQVTKLCNVIHTWFRSEMFGQALKNAGVFTLLLRCFPGKAKNDVQMRLGSDNILEVVFSHEVEAVHQHLMKMFNEDCVRDGRPALDVPDNNALYFPELLADCQNPAAPLPPSKLLEGANLEEVDLTMSTMSYVAAQAPQQPLIVERGRRGSIIGAVKGSSPLVAPRAVAPPLDVGPLPAGLRLTSPRASEGLSPINSDVSPVSPTAARQTISVAGGAVLSRSSSSGVATPGALGSGSVTRIAQPPGGGLAAPNAVSTASRMSAGPVSSGVAGIGSVSSLPKMPSLAASDSSTKIVESSGEIQVGSAGSGSSGIPRVPSTGSSLAASGEVFKIDKPLDEWSVDEVYQWMASLGLTDAGEVLRRQEVDGSTLKELSIDELKDDLDIKILGQRKKIIRERDGLLGMRGSGYASVQASGGGSSSAIAIPNSNNASAANVVDESDLIPANEIQLVRKIGGGFFGQVWEALWHSHTKVAVKWLTNGGSNDEFLSEVRILKKVKHPHVIVCYGLSLDPQTNTLRLVTEMLDGSLLDYLRDQPMDLNNNQMTKISVQICNGMHHLVQKGIVHRDLAARNVLYKKRGMGECPEMKLCDFGLGRQMDNNYYSISAPGAALPIKWTAPEALEKKRFSQFSDVWSFGVLMWEIWSFGTEPYVDWNAREVLQRIKAGERMRIPLGCPQEVYALMMQCWDLEPKRRPTFEKLYSQFTEMDNQNERELRQAELELSGSGAYLTTEDATSSDLTQSGSYYFADK